MTNYVGVDTRGILDGTDAEIRRIRSDRSLSEEQRAFYISELQTKGRDEYAAARKKADDKLDSQRQDATSRRYPVETGGDVATELRLSRIREELRAQWEARDSGPSLQEYERAVQTGDDLRAQVIERFGPGHVSNSDMRHQLTRRVEEVEAARMTDDQRAADAELARLDQVELNHRMAQEQQDRSAREMLDRPAEELARTRPGDVQERPGIAPQGSAFH